MAEDLPEYTAFLVDDVGRCDCFPCTAKPEVHHPKHLPTFAPWMRPAKALGGKPGKGQRCSDWYSNLLCPHHHADLHRGKGFFKDWSKVALRAWQEKAAAAHQKRWGMRHPERLPGSGIAPRKARKTRTPGKGWTVAGVLSFIRKEADHRPADVSEALLEIAEVITADVRS